MERIEDKPEGKFMTAIFGEKGPNYYSYIVVEEDGKERRIELTEAIQEALATVSLKEKKALELRFGLLDGRSRTLKEVSQELLGVTGSRAQQIVAKALRKLRYPSRSRPLRQFIVLSPEKINHLKKEIDRLRDENRSLNEGNQRLKKILEGCGVTEEDVEGIKPENLASAAKALKEDREALQSLISRFPKKLVWNSIRRRGVTELSKLKDLVRSGEIRTFRNISERGEEFLKEILQK